MGYLTETYSLPSLANSWISCGTSVKWPAAKLLAPTTWTSASTACWAASAGVWKSGPTSTSKPEPFFAHNFSKAKCLDKDYTKICKSSSNNFRSTVMTVLTHLSYHNTWLTTFLCRELLHTLHHLGTASYRKKIERTLAQNIHLSHFIRLSELRLISTRHHSVDSSITGKWIFTLERIIVLCKPMVLNVKRNSYATSLKSKN